MSCYVRLTARTYTIRYMTNPLRQSRVCQFEKPHRFTCEYELKEAGYLPVGLDIGLNIAARSTINFIVKQAAL